MVSTDAATLGATAMPDPLGEVDYSWLYWADHTFSYPGTAVSGLEPFGSLRKSFDVRSMRKMKPRESLIMVVQYADSSGAPPLTFFAASTRVLIGLH